MNPCMPVCRLWSHRYMPLILKWIIPDRQFSLIWYMSIDRNGESPDEEALNGNGFNKYVLKPDVPPDSVMSPASKSILIWI